MLKAPEILDYVCDIFLEIQVVILAIIKTNDKIFT